MDTEYDAGFYDTISQGAEFSAMEVVPKIINLYNPNTVVDVGCGRGIWAKEFERKSCLVTGIDGPWVTDPLIADFRPIDISQEFDINARFDVAVCLEVAEHLPVWRAQSFVQDLCKLSDTIVFSAAIPFQTGTHHINCQWQSWWASIFWQEGYGANDALRWQMWNNVSIEPWYRQNMVIYEKNADFTPVLDVVHPDIHYWGR